MHFEYKILNERYKMNIGTVIKKYRNKRDLTQEQLAEYLNVSVSAVSQWESSKTLPDISTLPVIASFFEITLDELFDRSQNEKEKAIEEYDKLSVEYSNQGNVAKGLELWRQATQKYPGDYHCLNKLAYFLLQTLYCGWDENEIEGNAKECVAISERILRDCTDNDTRNSAIQRLVYVYSFTGTSLANEEKAVEYANMAGSIHISRESLLESAYFTEESKEKKLYTKHRNILTLIDDLTMRMYYSEYESTEDKIKACNAALSMWNALIYDGNYQFFHCRIEKIYTTLAMSYANLKLKEETLNALKKALYHARCFDNLESGEHHYTSIFVNAATSDNKRFSKNYSGTNENDVLRLMGTKAFDFLREDEEFKNIK